MTIRATAEAPPTAATSRYAKWAIALFFVALSIPGSFYMGVRMTPYRLYLILMAGPMVMRFLGDATLRITAVDVLVLLASLWQAIAILVNHQTSQIIFAGANFLEFFFGYMLGRVFIRNSEDFRFFFKCFLVTLIFFLPFGLIEATTFQRVLRRVAGYLLIQPSLDLSGQIRFGLMRAQLSFDHAILFGAFCSIGFANVYYVYNRIFPTNILLALFVAFMTFLSISNAPMIALFIQFSFIVYEAMFRRVVAKWILGVFFFALFWVVFQMIFSQNIVEYILSNLIINQAGVSTRIWQFEYGMRDVLANPIFGIGLNSWSRPFWIGGAIDNYWLNTSIKFGLVEMLLLLAAMVTHAIKIMMASDLTEYEIKCRLGYIFSYVALIFTLSTVSLWGIIIVFKMVYIGSGAWFYNKAQAETGRPVRRRPSARRLSPST